VHLKLKSISILKLEIYKKRGSREFSFLFQFLGCGGNNLVHNFPCGVFDRALPYCRDHSSDLRFASVTQFGLTALFGQFDVAYAIDKAGTPFPESFMRVDFGGFFSANSILPE